MKSPKFSIVMPVFNTEPYLAQAIESVLQQDYQDFELIIINDGSYDASQAIIDRYCALDNRIKAVSQPNQGLSASRNRGIDLALGKYLYFMDSDDRAESTLLTKVLRAIDSTNVDLLFFDAATFSEEFNLSQMKGITLYQRTLTIPASVKPGYLMFQELLDNSEYFSSVCLLIIERQWLSHMGIRFKVGALHEDELFSAILFLEARKVVYLPEKLFWRRYRINSIMTCSFSMRNAEAYLTTAQDLLDHYRHGDNKKKKLAKRYVRLMLNAAIRKGHLLPKRQRFKLLLMALMRFPSFISTRTFAILLLKGKLKAQ